MKLTPLRIKKFQDFIFNWWETHRRDLPWRRTHDPYRILVSEVMLQQTQVSRVIPKYTEFIRIFPDVFALAAASVGDVLRAWKGMGYNRRALYLKKTAERVVQAYEGHFPQTEKELVQLPGLGTYTARAILVFAFRKNVAPVDTNIRQIITHYFFEDTHQKESIIAKVADLLLPHDKSWEWGQALMDYGALEMPKLRPKKEKKISSIPFKETNRFYRGRIMDTLRMHDIREFILLKEFREKYDKPEDFLIHILQGLEKDGLITRSKEGLLSLPT